MQCALAGRVLALMWSRAFTQDRADVHDERLPPLTQNRDRFANELNWREVIHFHQWPHATRIGLDESPVCCYARVVDKDIEATEFIACCFERATPRIGVRHISGNTNRAAAKCLDLGRQLLKPISPPREKNDARSLSCKTFCEF